MNSEIWKWKAEWRRENEEYESWKWNRDMKSNERIIEEKLKYVMASERRK